ncbi:hypothetical protein Tco_0439295 [Tanacetum coccineum]
MLHPSTKVISEGAPAVTESILPHQVPLPDTSDSDIETLFDNVDRNSRRIRAIVVLRLGLSLTMLTKDLTKQALETLVLDEAMLEGNSWLNV